jgi:AAA+ ATPase superfamily predicted ATPase
LAFLDIKYYLYLQINTNNKMVGREEEIRLLEEKYSSNKSEFIALYGRRRVGKTYLIRTTFKNRFTFQLTGLANATLQQQLINFQITINEQHPTIASPSSSWMDAFQQIKRSIEKSKQEKKVIFIDELPWFDTPKSGFIQALEHFWNSWASARKDILLIVCGSAASWMINKLINNKGGLHNRVTQKLKIAPFTLKECELMLKSKKITLDQYQIIQLYMVLGGIPFYWDEVEKGLSATQNIEKLCFTTNGLLRTEFPNVLKSLFSKADKHELIVETLAKKSKGLTREELLQETKFNNGGSVTRLLNELEESGFITKYIPFDKKSRNSLYQLTDFYSQFYLKFIKNYQLTDSTFWTKNIDNPKYRAWSGYAFEQVCLYHLPAIKKALGISGIETKASSWRSTSAINGAQIDLVIDRRDEIINLCEMKFSINQYLIDKKTDANLRNKIGCFKTETKTKKSVFLTMISTFGLQENAYSGNIQNDLKMDVLFES